MSSGLPVECAVAYEVLKALEVSVMRRIVIVAVVCMASNASRAHPASVSSYRAVICEELPSGVKADAISILCEGIVLFNRKRFESSYILQQ